MSDPFLKKTLDELMTYMILNLLGLNWHWVLSMLMTTPLEVFPCKCARFNGCNCPLEEDKLLLLADSLDLKTKKRN